MSGKLHRFEPINTQCDEEHPQCINMLMDAGWFSFFENIRGYNVEVTQNSLVSLQDLMLNSKAEELEY